MEGGESGSRLKGDLVKKSEGSKLRGDLVRPKSPATSRKEQLSQLRGSLIEKLRKSSDGLPKDELAIGAKLVQRDSGLIYTVTGLTETKYGQRVNLTGSDGRRFTTSSDRLREVLTTEEGAWVKKPEE